MSKENIKIVDKDYKTEEEEFSLPCPNPPENLAYEAQLEWINSAPQFHEAGLLHGIVESMFENYCKVQGNAREAHAMLQVDGKVINGKLHPRVNDEIAQIKEAGNIWSKLIALLEAQKDRQIKLKELEMIDKMAQGDKSHWTDEKRKLLA